MRSSDGAALHDSARGTFEKLSFAFRAQEEKKMLMRVLENESPARSSYQSVLSKQWGRPVGEDANNCMLAHSMS